MIGLTFKHDRAEKHNLTMPCATLNSEKVGRHTAKAKVNWMITNAIQL